MAFVTPTDVTVGSVLTASRYNADVVANMTELAPFFSAFTSWTPTLTQTVAVTTTNFDSKYVKVGRLVIASFSLIATASGTNGGTVVVGFGSGATALPTARAATSIFGSFRFLDAGVTNYVGTVTGATTTTLNFYKDGDGNPLGPTNPVQVTNNDTMNGFIIYEAAS
jgi:hypothetical protein